MDPVAEIAEVEAEIAALNAEIATLRAKESALEKLIGSATNDKDKDIFTQQLHFIRTMQVSVGALQVSKDNLLTALYGRLPPVGTRAPGQPLSLADLPSYGEMAAFILPNHKMHPAWKPANKTETLCSEEAQSMRRNLGNKCHVCGKENASVCHLLKNRALCGCFS